MHTYIFFSHDDEQIFSVQKYTNGNWRAGEYALHDINGFYNDLSLVYKGMYIQSA